MDKKVFSVYMGNPDNHNHAELELPATPWELVDALDKLRLEDGQRRGKRAVPRAWRKSRFPHRRYAPRRSCGGRDGRS